MKFGAQAVITRLTALALVPALAGEPFDMGSMSTVGAAPCGRPDCSPAASVGACPCTGGWPGRPQSHSIPFNPIDISGRHGGLPLQFHELFGSQALALDAVNSLKHELPGTPSIDRLARSQPFPDSLGTSDSDLMNDREQGVVNHAQANDFFIAGLSYLWPLIERARASRDPAQAPITRWNELRPFFDNQQMGPTPKGIMRRWISQGKLKVISPSVHAQALAFLRTCSEEQLGQLLTDYPDDPRPSMTRRILSRRRWPMESIESLGNVRGFDDSSFGNPIGKRRLDAFLARLYTLPEVLQPPPAEVEEEAPPEREIPTEHIIESVAPMASVLDLTREVRDQILAHANLPDAEKPPKNLEISIPFTPHEWLAGLATTLQGMAKHPSVGITYAEYQNIRQSIEEGRRLFVWALSILVNAHLRGSERKLSKNLERNRNILFAWISFANQPRLSFLTRVSDAFRETFPPISPPVYVSAAEQAVIWTDYELRKAHGNRTDKERSEKAHAAYAILREGARRNLNWQLWNDKGFLPEFRTVARIAVANSQHPLSTLWDPRDLVELTFDDGEVRHASRELETGA